MSSTNYSVWLTIRGNESINIVLQLIPTTKLIQGKNHKNPSVIFSIRWGATISRIDDLYICPPNNIRFISLVGYTLFLIVLACSWIGLRGVAAGDHEFYSPRDQGHHAVLLRHDAILLWAWWQDHWSGYLARGLRRHCWRQG